MNGRIKLGLGLGTLGVCYTMSQYLTPEKVVSGVVETMVTHTYQNMGDLSERERLLQGKICRPVLPTSGEELSNYLMIMGELKGAKIKMILGGVVGSVGGAAVGVISTRRIESSAKRIIARLILVPSLVSLASLVLASATLAHAVYGIRDRSSSILTPVGQGTEATLRKTLPSSVVNTMTFKTIPGLEK